MSIVSAHRPTQLDNESRVAKVATFTRLWNFRPTDDFGQDNKTGRRYANAVLRGGESIALEAVFKEMITLGVVDGTHVGFLHRVSELAMKAYAAGL